MRSLSGRPASQRRRTTRHTYPWVGATCCRPSRGRRCRGPRRCRHCSHDLPPGRGPPRRACALRACPSPASRRTRRWSRPRRRRSRAAGCAAKSWGWRARTRASACGGLSVAAHGGRCSGSFCNEHRYPECHACPHDYKKSGRALLAAAKCVQPMRPTCSRLAARSSMGRSCPRSSVRECRVSSVLCCVRWDNLAP